MAAPPVSEVVRIRDDNGGVLAVERAFTPRGYPLLVHSGSPGSRRLRPRQVERAAEAGFCLVSYDRPGYGDSSPHTGRVVASAADDVALIADALGYAELAVWGFSGGGPFALAAAAGLSQVVLACCLIASLSPYEPLGRAWPEPCSADSQAQVELFFTDRAQPAVRSSARLRSRNLKMASTSPSPP
jgi:pimeloyl-ACP methyl ester carboxylesterase